MISVQQSAFHNSSFNDAITLTSNGNFIQYTSDEYFNKVFKYFVLELIRENQIHNLFSQEDIFKLVNNKINIDKDNIKEQPISIQTLYEDAMNLKNNYLFAYYLSRLSEYRNLSNNKFSSNKYFKYAEYIISLETDISDINWDLPINDIKNTLNLHGIFSEKMHSLTKEFIKNKFILEITSRENIDDINDTYLTNIKKSKFININSVEECSDDSDSVEECSDDSDSVEECCDDSDSVEECCDDSEEECCDDSDSVEECSDDSDSVEECCDDSDIRKKRKFEELVFTIINKSEKNKKFKFEENHIRTEYQRDAKFNKIIIFLLRCSLLYCIISYLTNYKCIIEYTDNKSINDSIEFDKIINYENFSNLNNILKNVKQCSSSYEFLP